MLLQETVNQEAGEQVLMLLQETVNQEAGEQVLKTSGTSSTPNEMVQTPSREVWYQPKRHD